MVSPAVTRYVTLAAACLAALSGGTVYIASSYGPQLAERLSLSSKSINTLLLSANSAVYLSGPFVGQFVDRRGPRVCLLVSAATIAVGYLGLRLFYVSGHDGLYAKTGLGGPIVLELLVGLGSQGAFTAASNAVAKQFGPKQRSTALSVAIAFLGSSAFVYSSLGASFLSSGDPTAKFLALLGFGCGGSLLLAGVVLAWVQRQPTAVETAAGTPYAAIPSEEDDVLLPPGTPRGGRARSRSPSPMLSGEAVVARSQSKDRITIVDPAQVEIGGRALFAELDFWLMLAFFGLLAGCGLQTINNIGTIVYSLAPVESASAEVHKTQQHLVGLISIFSATGRLLIGPITDAFAFHVPKRIRLPRVSFTVPIACLFWLTQAWMARTASLERLWAPVTVTGYAYGSLCALCPMLIINFFGVESFSTNNGVASLSPFVSGGLINLLFGWNYDRHVQPDQLSARAGGGGPPSKVCHEGLDCYKDSFAITQAWCVVAIGVGIVLAWRRSRVPAL